MVPRGVWLSAIALGAAADLAAEARLRRDPELEARARTAAGRLHARAYETAQRGAPPAGMGPEGRAWLLRADAEHARVVAPEDVEPWRRASAAFGYGHAYEQARCAFGAAAARLVRDAGDDRRAAQDDLRWALDTARALGAVPLADAVEALGRRARLEVGAAPPAATTLTRREQEVLRLLAEGCTNRQVGERLFMAEKTASVHVSRIMAKLGTRSRAEAVSVGHRTGLLP